MPVGFTLRTDDEVDRWLVQLQLIDDKDAGQQRPYREFDFTVHEGNQRLVGYLLLRYLL